MRYNKRMLEKPKLNCFLCDEKLEGINYGYTEKSKQPRIRNRTIYLCKSCFNEKAQEGNLTQAIEKVGAELQ